MKVLVTGARSPAALEIARLLYKAGCEVHVADSAPMLAAGSRAVSAAHQLPAARDFAAFGCAIADLQARHAFELVIPTCEEVFYLAALKANGLDLPLFTADFATLRQLHNKFEFIQLARAAGVEVPETQLLTSREEAISVRGNMIFKPVYSRFGVNIKASGAEISPTLARPWIAQQRLSGEELCCTAIAREGAVLAQVTYRPKYRMGQAASFYFEPVTQPDVAKMAERIVAATRFTGQIAFDVFVLPDGRVMPIECNPRATSGIHLFAGRVDVGKAILGASAAPLVAESRAKMLASAMLTLGLPALLKHPASWWQDFRHAGDVLNFEGDHLTMRAMRTTLQMALQALRQGKTLREISTQDIEWDGQKLSADGAI